MQRFGLSAGPLRYTWWQLEQDLEISFEREEQVLAKTGDKRKAREAGEALLMRLGIAKQDAKLILTAAQVHDSRRHLDLQEESAKTKGRQGDARIKQKDRDLSLVCKLCVRQHQDYGGDI